MDNNTIRKTNRWVIAFIAAAFILVVVAVVGVCSANAEKYVVDIDVNPSIELGVDGHGNVCSTKALNYAGQEILDECDLDDVAVDDAVAKVVDQMASSGYLNENQNTALLSISGLKKDKAETLGDLLSDKIADVASSYGVDAAVATQIVEVIPEKIGNIAEQLGVSNGRAELISQVAAAALKTDVKQFSDFSVNDLMVLAESLNLDLKNIDLSGIPSKSGYISEDSALQTVLDQFGIKKTDIVAPTTKMTVGLNTVAYDVDFIFEGANCEYSVDAKSGETMTAAELTEKVQELINGQSTEAKLKDMASTGMEAATQAASGDIAGAFDTVKYSKNKATAEKIVGIVGEDTELTIGLGGDGTNGDVGEIKASMNTTEKGNPGYKIDFGSGSGSYGIVIDSVTGEVTFG